MLKVMFFRSWPWLGTSRVLRTRAAVVGEDAVWDSLPLRSAPPYMHVIAD